MIDPVLIIPGLMCDARAVLHQMNDLGRTRLVVLALPTMGATVEDMAQAILATAPARFAVVGMGLGGDIALELLRKAEDRVMRLALISMDPLAETPQQAAHREARMVAARAGRLQQALAEEIPPGALAEGPRKTRVQKLLSEMWQGLGSEIYLKQSKAMQRRPDHQRTMRTAKRPALLIAGEHDPLVPVRRQEFAAGLMQFARVAVVPGAGHLPTMEAPEAVNALLAEFLQGPMVLSKPSPLVLK